MTAERTYLDYNASAPLLPEARAAMLAALEVCGNPSSVHAEGRHARAIVEAAREEVAALVNARPSEVVFTSGATEANAWAMGAGWDTVVVSGLEHESVRAPAASSGARLVLFPATAAGIADLGAAGAVLPAGAERGRAVLALQMANNETGVVQPVAAAAELATANGLALHCDAVQAVGRMPVDFAALGCDTMSLSSHKIGGPKGAGALVIRDGMTLAPLIAGGGQERRRRAGTENVAAIAGFGAAARAARDPSRRDGADRRPAGSPREGDPAPDAGSAHHWRRRGAPRQHDLRRLARQVGGDARHQARSRGDSGERGGGVLGRQGRREPRALCHGPRSGSRKKRDPA